MKKYQAVLFVFIGLLVTMRAAELPPGLQDFDAFVTFAFTPDGTIEQVKMEAISPLTDFSFDFHDLVLKPVVK